MDPCRFLHETYFVFVFVMKTHSAFRIVNSLSSATGSGLILDIFSFYIYLNKTLVIYFYLPCHYNLIYYLYVFFINFLGLPLYSFKLHEFSGIQMFLISLQSSALDLTPSLLTFVNHGKINQLVVVPKSNIF